jgi:hypothetical protein
VVEINKPKSVFHMALRYIQALLVLEVCIIGCERKNPFHNVLKHPQPLVFVTVYGLLYIHTVRTYYSVYLKYGI